MSIPFAYLKERLISNVPVHEGVPDDKQYTQAVIDAVADYSRRCPVELYADLNIVSGIATYDLPADFLTILSLALPSSESGVLHTAGGLVEVSKSWKMPFAIAGRTLTFEETPTAALTLTLKYSAEHVLDENSDYEYMTQAEADIMMLKAQANALMVLANSVIMQAWSYRLEGESVSKEKLPAVIREQAEAFETNYDRRIRARTGAHGIRSRYTAAAEAAVKEY